MGNSCKKTDRRGIAVAAAKTVATDTLAETVLALQDRHRAQTELKHLSDVPDILRIVPLSQDLFSNGVDLISVCQHNCTPATHKLPVIIVTPFSKATERKERVCLVSPSVLYFQTNCRRDVRISLRGLYYIHPDNDATEPLLSASWIPQTAMSGTP